MIIGWEIATYLRMLELTRIGKQDRNADSTHKHCMWPVMRGWGWMRKYSFALPSAGGHWTTTSSLWASCRGFTLYNCPIHIRRVQLMIKCSMPMSCWQILLRIACFGLLVATVSLINGVQESAAQGECRLSVEVYGFSTIVCCLLYTSDAADE